MLRRTCVNGAPSTRMGDFLGKMFRPNTYELQGRQRRRQYLAMISAAMFSLYGMYNFRTLLGVDSEEKIAVMVGWRGEYVQDFAVAGQPPMNLNLPPHLRTDQKSYLDLPDTVIQPPPEWDTLHPYLQYRMHDLFLSPAGTKLKPYPETTYNPRRTWGSSYMIADESVLTEADIDQAEDAVLHKQRAKSVHA